MSMMPLQIQRAKVNRTQNGPKAVLVGENSAEKGLSLLVQQVLGRPLDKTEQMSNWKKRPLRISQIRYAGKVLHAETDNYRDRCSYHSRISKIIL